MKHPEKHLVHRSGWLRAAVLGANDGIVSIPSLVIGVASAGAPRSGVLVAGVAGLVAGAMSGMFSAGAALPLLAVVLTPGERIAVGNWFGTIV